MSVVVVVTVHGVGIQHNYVVFLIIVLIQFGGKRIR